MLKGGMIGIQYSMDQIRKRQQRYAELERKRQREEIMAEKRVWIEPPSPVFEMPSRIQRGEWENFQNLLDSLGEKDINLVDVAYKKYLQEQWLKFSSPEWSDENAVNTLRILFRLQLVEKCHTKTIIDLAFEARKEFQESNDQHAGSVLLLLLKEIAIHLEETSCGVEKNQSFWEGETRQLLNQFISTLKIYRYFTGTEDNQFQQIFKDYRIYYIVLLVDPRVNLQEFVRLRNVGELYYNINDCINQSDSFQLAKSIELIKKMMEIKGSEEVAKCLDGVSVLLIQGIMQAKHFLDDEPYPKEHKGMFFQQFLKAISNADVRNVLSGIELLALLFDRFDQCIPAALQVKILVESQEQSIVRPTQFEDYTAFIESSMQSIAYEVRLKSYWLISNITGSSNYFKQYGLPLITHIYQKGYFFLQRENQSIINEITICVLNYLCNITRPDEIMQLIEIEAKKMEEKELNHKPNCFLFCLDVTCNIIESICLTADHRSNILLEKEYIGMIHRVVYSLLMILEHAEDNLDMIVSILEREKVYVMLQQFHSKLTEHSNHTQLLNLLTNILAHFNTHTKQL